MVDLAVVSVANRAALKSVNSSAEPVVTLADEGGRNGTFVWTTGNFSSQVAADTGEGVYIKANAIAATSGAWIRSYSGPLNVEWFGAVGDGAADDTGAIQAAINLCSLFDGGKVYIPTGRYKVTSTMSVLTNHTTIYGDGPNATTIVPSALGMNCFMFGNGTSTAIEYCGVQDLSIIPTVAIDRGVWIRNHYWFIGRNVQVYGNHDTAFEFENGSVAYLGFLHDVISGNSASYGCVLGRAGSGDLQNVLLYNSHFDGAGASGLQVVNVGGLMWVGGEALTCNRALNLAPTGGKRVAAAYFQNIYFDTATNEEVRIHGSAGNRVSDLKFINCSFNNSVNGCGVIIDNETTDSSIISGISFIGCSFIINKAHGLYTSYAALIDISNCQFVSNGQDGVSHGILFNTGTRSARVIGGFSGSSGVFAPAQRYGILVAASTSDIRLNGVDLNNNVVAPLSDLGSPGMVVRDCAAVKTFAKGASSVPAGSNSATINHGLSFPPAKEDIFITLAADPNGRRWWVSAVTAATFTISLDASAVNTFYFGWSAGVKGN